MKTFCLVLVTTFLGMATGGDLGRDRTCACRIEDILEGHQGHRCSPCPNCSESVVDCDWLTR